MPPKSKRPESINRTAIITTTITVIGTIIAALLAAPWIKDVFQHAPTPTLSPTPTNTIAPNLTSTFTPTSKPVAECPIELADSIFKRVLAQDPSLTDALGSQMMPRPTCVWSSYQPFEGGEMIWRSDVLYPTDIYVLFSSDEWKSFKSNYKSGAPLRSCDAEPSKEKLLQPVLGFGKVWCDQDLIGELGYAIIEEKPLDRPRQTFENGWLILINNTVYVLFDQKGTWVGIRAFEDRPISLQSQSELKAPEANLGLGQGPVNLPKNSLSILDPLSGKPLIVPFDLGWKVSTQCEYLSSRPENVQIGVNISHPLNVYLLLQAGWGLKDYDGHRIGKVTLEFNNSNSIEIPLILGTNIRDWADRSTAVTNVSSSSSQLAWEGKDPNGTPGRMDILINDIPSNYWPLTLKRIQIWDESRNSIGRLDPCIHLLAVTVRHLP
jgi:hypothetical protein